MKRRLSTLLQDHYALLVSSLISSIIVCLAILGGLSKTSESPSRAWAMPPSEPVKTTREMPATTPEAPAEEAPMTPAADSTRALAEKYDEDPAIDDSSQAGYPEPPRESLPPARKETEEPGAVVKALQVEIEPAPRPVEILVEKPAPIRPTVRPVLRTLRPRPAPPIRQGRILRPRR